MIKQTRTWSRFLLAVPLVLALAACSADDRPDRAGGATNPVVGSFVGKVKGTGAFLAVVAAPIEGGDAGGVHIYVSDGRGLSESLSGSISGERFVAASDDGDAEVRGELSEDSVTGTVALPGGKTGRYEASPPSGTAGLYELTVSSAGELSGASAAGLIVTGEVPLRKHGTGTLRMVDGESLEFAVTRDQASDLAHLQAGQVRLILLPGGELRGAGRSRQSGGDGSDFFIRSA
jgi:hypothetical protein